MLSSFDNILSYNHLGFPRPERLCIARLSVGGKCCPKIPVGRGAFDTHAGQQACLRCAMSRGLQMLFVLTVKKLYE